ncbi:MAG: hypothetical protein LH628_26365 [Microcoleus sp. CAN_BIN18]|nr:hypothetical protein [Microcoleus sp. CAN_BIN18]
MFAKDTDMVLECLLYGTPLYVKNTSSLYALKVADVAGLSSEIGENVALSNSQTTS